MITVWASDGKTLVELDHVEPQQLEDYPDDIEDDGFVTVHPPVEDAA